MKFKSVLKFGLPILAAAGLAVSLPLAITSCSNSDSKTEENKVVSTSQQDVNNAIANLGDLATETLGGQENAVKNQNVFDTLSSSLKLSDKEILNVNYSKNSSTSGGVGAATLVSQAESNEQGTETPSTKSSWTIQVTLKDNYSWSDEIIETSKESKNNVEIKDKTLLIKDVETKFATIGISKEKLVKNEEKFSEALNEIKDLANYAPQVANGKQTQADAETKQEKLFIANFVEKVPSIPLTALVAQLSVHTTSDSNGVGETSDQSGNTQSKLDDKQESEEGKTGLTLSKNKVDAKISTGKDYVIFDNYKPKTEEKELSSITYNQVIDYNFVDINSLAASITSFVSAQEVNLDKSGKTTNLKVNDGSETIELPVKYDVMNPFSQQTKLGMSGTYALNFSFDFSKFGYKDSTLVSTIQSSLNSTFGSSSTYPTKNKSTVASFDESTNQLNIQVMSDVFAVTKESLIDGANYLKHFTKEQLSSVQGSQKDTENNSDMNTNIRIGLLESMGFYELISPMVNYMKVTTVNVPSKNNQTTLKIEFGVNQSGTSFSNGKMATLSKELQNEISKDSNLGQKGVEFKFEPPTTTGTIDGKSTAQQATPASLSISIDNSELSIEPKLTMSNEEKMKDLGAWLENVNANTFKPTEFIKQTGMGSGAQDQIVGLALESSEIIKTVTSKLGVDKNDIFQVRLVTTKSKDGNPSLRFLVILNSGLTFGQSKEINIENASDSKVKVTAKIGNTFSYGKDNNDTLTFTISSNPAGPKQGK